MPSVGGTRAAATKEVDAANSSNRRSDESTRSGPLHPIEMEAVNALLALSGAATAPARSATSAHRFADSPALARSDPLPAIKGHAHGARADSAVGREQRPDSVRDGCSWPWAEQLIPPVGHTPSAPVIARSPYRARSGTASGGVACHAQSRPVGPKKRRRTTPVETEVLFSIFSSGNMWPNKDFRIALAQNLDMTERQIQIWFQNMRQKLRRARATRANAPGTPTPVSVVAPLTDQGAPSIPSPASPMDVEDTNAARLSAREQ